MLILLLALLLLAACQEPEPRRPASVDSLAAALRLHWETTRRRDSLDCEAVGLTYMRDCWPDPGAPPLLADTLPPPTKGTP